MKKGFLVVCLTAAALLICACSASSTKPKKPQPEVTTTTAETEPVPVYEEFTATLENSDNKEFFLENQPSFLNDEQKAVWSEAFFMTYSGVTGKSFGLQGDYEKMPRKSAEGNEYHYIRTGVSYDGMRNYILTAFTEEYTDDVFLSYVFINDGGELLYIDNAREADISYRSHSFDLISKTDSEVKFRMTSHYSWDGIAKLGNLDKGESVSHSEEHYFTMKKTDSGWRFSSYSYWL